MFLKSLELHGFKSFPEKTVLNFDSGATIIVGPNGSGKSNITDAMRWVLGELSSKSMRGSKMEDVVFVGADGFKPMSFAEVSVTFDNTDPENRLNSPYDEITVTRRYSRGGEGEYLINKKPVRLRDIYELFMNTGIGREGYSIIGQGRVSEILSKKSEDRRGIFEETAGISKFRYKKQEAEKKLGEVSANMLRAADILKELEARVGPLERDSRKARQYLEYYKEKKEADVSLWLYDITKVRADLEKCEADTTMSRHELDMASDTEAALSAQNERLFEASQDNKITSERIYSEIKALRERESEISSALASVKSEIVYSERRIGELAERREKLDVSLAAEEERRRELGERLGTARGLVSEAEEECRLIGEEREASGARIAALAETIERKFAELGELDSAKNDITVRLDVLKNSLSDREGKSAEMLADISRIEGEIADIDRKLGELNGTLEDYNASIRALTEEAGKADSRLGEITEKQDAVSGERVTAEAKAASLDGRISALRRMQEHFDGFNNSVRFVMGEKKAGRLKGIIGPLSDVIRVKDEYTVAIECALGAALQNIVTENEASAQAAMAALKREKAGRATFYPITSVTAQTRNRETEAAAGADGFVGFADTLVEYGDQYARIISSLLSRTAVFTDIRSAETAARASGWRLRAVTLDAQQINPGGSFTGGSVKRDSGLLTRNTAIENLEKERRAAEAELKRLSGILSELSNEGERIRREIRLSEEKRKLSEALMRTELAECDELKAKRKVLEDLLGGIREDIEGYENERRMAIDNISVFGDKLAELASSAAKLREERAELDIERNAEADRLAELGEKYSAAQIRMAESRRDVQAAEESLTELDGRIAAVNADIVSTGELIATVGERIAEGRRAIGEREKELTEIRDQLDGSEKNRASVEGNGMEFERKLNELRLKLRDISAKKETLFTVHSKNEHRLEGLRETVDSMLRRLWDEYELTQSSAEDLGYPEANESNRREIAERATSLKNSIKALGHVNLDSIDEYVAVKERYDSIKLQTDDLEASKTDLEEIISSLEGDMKGLFLDAFGKVNRYFGEVFRELFDGGNAELELTDPTDPLGCGIEIKAAPPGKMIKNLTLLSGGEQSFVAIALIFALIRVNPSPFCIFDEIESALDDVNVRRVGRYIKRFASEMQIIMITHRRGTMEIADTLYGVTMPKHGVSRVFSLDVGDMNEEFTQ